MNVFEAITDRYAEVDHYARGFGLHKIGDNKIAFRTEKAQVLGSGIDRGAMSVPCIVTTQDEDRSLDIILTDGVDIEAHSLNPVVNYNHAMNGSMLPIGKAQDPNGKYTVTREPGMLKAVTWFSQNLTEAAQIFQLIEEGILNGVSIGCIPIETEKRQNMNWKGMPGLLVKRCEMFEYSHTSNPDNRQALTERVLRGVLAGKAIGPALYKSLAPYLIPQSEAAIVPRTVRKEIPAFVLAALVPPLEKMSKDTQSCVSAKMPKLRDEGYEEDQALAIAYSMCGEKSMTPDDKNKKPGEYAPIEDKATTPAGISSEDKQPANKPSAETSTNKPGGDDSAKPSGETGNTNKPGEPQADDDPTADYPPGAKAAAGVHDRLMEMAGFISDQYKRQEPSGNARAMLEELTAEIDERAAGLKDFFKAEYPDLPELGGEAKPDDEVMEGEEKEPKEKVLRTLRRLVLPYRKSIIAGIKGARDSEARLEALTVENEKLKKALKNSLDECDKVREAYKKARRGR